MPIFKLYLPLAERIPRRKGPNRCNLKIPFEKNSLRGEIGNHRSFRRNHVDPAFQRHATGSAFLHRP